MYFLGFEDRYLALLRVPKDGKCSKVDSTLRVASLFQLHGAKLPLGSGLSGMELGIGLPDPRSSLDGGLVVLESIVLGYFLVLLLQLLRDQKSRSIQNFKM